MSENNHESPQSASPADWKERAKTLIEALNKIDHLMRPYRYREMPNHVWWEIYGIAADAPRLSWEDEERLKSTAESLTVEQAAEQVMKTQEKTLLKLRIAELEAQVQKYHEALVQIVACSNFPSYPTPVEAKIAKKALALTRVNNQKYP
jgi:hypothetical protein